MPTHIYIIAIAAILVVTKLILEHQHNNDILNNEEDDPSTYTFWGMIKSLRTRRRERKMERDKKVKGDDSLFHIQAFDDSLITRNDSDKEEN